MAIARRDEANICDHMMMLHSVKLFRAALTAVLVLAAGAPLAGQLEDALAAYQSGDWTNAIRLLRPLAEHGSDTAQYNLGTIYQKGQGVPQDYVEARKWFRLAADQGNANAQASLGFLYHYGFGMGRNNYPLALAWYGFAADQGNAFAQYNLGLMYARGEGVPQDYVQAYMWLTLSAARGRQDAVKLQAQAADMMTPTQIAEARALAREWKPRSSQVSSRQDNIAPLTRKQNPSSRTEVPLKAAGGVFVVPVEINGTVTLDFAIDSGASDVSVPADVFSTLERAGAIKDSDITGQEIYVLADGSKSQSTTFTIKSLRIGNLIVENVRGSVAPPQGSLLLGQSFLQRFKSWSIDNTKHELLLVQFLD